MKKINPFLWFNTEAEEAARLYTSLFTDAKLTGVNKGGPDGSVFVVTFTIAGLEFVGLNGGPQYRPNPAISMFVECDTDAEIERLWNGLMAEGKVLMALDKYPWSDRYAWVEDKFGVSWQMSLVNRPQSVSPTLMFTGEQQGRAKEAIDLYTSLFPDSGLDFIVTYEPGEQGPEGQVKYSEWHINGQRFGAMDSHMQVPIPFTPGVSLNINCETQEEVDRYWEKLAEGGRHDRCGWLQDKFGVSWQVVPTALGEIMSSGDGARAGRVMQRVMQMDKLIISELEAA